MGKFQIILLVTLVVLSGTNGLDFFSWFRRSNSSTSTTTIRPSIRSTTLSTTTTDRVFTPPLLPLDNSCWWTICGKNCAAGSSVYEANRCDTGNYKFRCCMS